MLNIPRKHLFNPYTERLKMWYKDGYVYGRWGKEEINTYYLRLLSYPPSATDKNILNWLKSIIFA